MSCTPPSLSSSAARTTSLAVATWRFESEPISQFATHIAKLFQNSVREDGLLSIANAGVTYFAGSFGTLQEIFQDLAQNGSAARAEQAAMVFVDSAAYGEPGSAFHLARARARHAASARRSQRGSSSAQRLRTASTLSSWTAGSRTPLAAARVRTCR